MTDEFDFYDNEDDFTNPAMEAPSFESDLLVDDGSYHPPSQTKFSPEIKESFLEKGYVLRWVYNDIRAIRERMNPQEGYSFVRPSELSPEQLTLLGTVESADGLYGGDHITNGDLILMKTTIERNEARKKYYRNKTQAQSDAINRRLQEQDIDSNSRSVVRTGKNAHFRS